MRKSGILVMTGIFTAFLFFTLGFFHGRNYLGSTVLISKIPPVESSESSSSSANSETNPPHSKSDSVPFQSPIVFPIDINTASAAEFDQLPGIGEVLARRIVDYRTENGAFQKLEDLMNIEGIGPSRLDHLRPYVTIGGT